MQIPNLSHQSICVIPARGGSKRIPLKNARKFHGKPIILWSIEAALAAECFREIIVSTDNQGIADIALEAGALVPSLRPAELSGDWIGTQPVIRHAIDHMSELANTRNDSQCSVCCLYATAPFVQAEDLRLGCQLLAGWDYVIPVTSYAFPIQRAVRLDRTDKALTMFSPQNYATRSQDLEEAYHDAGQFYWGTVNAWRCDESPYQMRSKAMVLPRWRVQDIDTEEDWQRAEAMFSAFHE